MVLSSLARAEDIWINPAGGTWNTGANWSKGSQPAFNDTATFDQGSTSGYTVTLPVGPGIAVAGIDVKHDTVTIDLHGNTDIQGVGDGRINIGINTGENATLIMTGPNAPGFSGHDPGWTAPSGVNIGTAGGTGSFTISNMTFQTTHGSYTIGNGSLLVNNNASLGQSLDDALNVGGIGSPATATFDNSQAIMQYGFNIKNNGSMFVTNHATVAGDFAHDGSIVVGGGVGNAAAAVTVDNATFQAQGSGSLIGRGAGPATVTVTNTGSFSILASLPQPAGGTGISIGGSGSTGSFTANSHSSVFFSVSGAPSMPHAMDIGASGGTGNLTVSGTGTTLSLNATQITVGADINGSAGTGTLQLDHNAAATVTPSTLLKIAAGGTLNVLSGATLAVKNLDLSSAGATNFTGGTINLTGGTLTAANLTMPNTGMLEGMGAITGNLSNFGTVAPGDAPGILTVNGNYSQDSAGTLLIGLAGPALGTQYDQLNVLGTASLAGTLDVTLLSGFVPSNGQQFHILAGSQNGSFSSVILPTLPVTSWWDASHLYINGTITVVPEPGVSTLLICSALGVLARRRRSAASGERGNSRRRGR